jgi:hypothetical protein
MRYWFVTVPQDEVNFVLGKHTTDGWRVHTINRNPGASMVDILFEKEPSR